MNFITRYKEKFKQMIVELNQTGCFVRGLMKEDGLSEAMIYKWKNLYLPDQSSGLSGKEITELGRLSLTSIDLKGLIV